MSHELNDKMDYGRPHFTLRQLSQAEKIGFVDPKNVDKRLSMKTYPIDDLPPEKLSDRDDGIFVEAKKVGKGTVVHVTIADVAAHVLPNTPLADAIKKRGFTVYRDGGNSTMLPQQLQDRLSLEDRQERYGLTISIELDAHYRPVHTEFQRVLTDTYATSYAQANEKMQTHPHFKLMTEIMHGMKQNYFGENYEMLQASGESKPISPNASENQIKATKLVEFFMLLANSQGAECLERNHVPFIPRNFDQGGNKAYYSTHSMGHADLAKKGLRGSYCHLTSPIRRAPDFYNQHQIHFMINMVQEAEAGLLAIDPTLDAVKLHRALWRDSTGLISHTAQNSLDIQPIQDSLSQLMHKLGTTLPDSALEKPLHDLTCKLAAWTPPYTTAQLDEVCDNVNKLMRAEQKQINKIAKSEDSIATAVRHLDALGTKSLRDVDPREFSMLLHDAALTGILPKSLLEEAHKRMNGANPNEYTLQPVKDGLQIMIVANHPTDPHWQSLKKGMATLIKHDPATVNGILSLAMNTPDVLRGGTLQAAEAGLMIADKHLSSHEAQIQGALLTYQSAPGAPLMSAPYYSIGHDARAAISHANYSFLEHYAFGQLRPVDQISVPNLLYAQLDNSENSRQQLVERMAESIGAKLDITRHRRQGEKPAVTLKLSGGSLKQPIIIRAEDVDLATAERAAFRKLLRQDRFKHAGSFLNMGDMQRALNPHKTLKELVDEQQGDLTLDIKETPTKQRQARQFTASFTITLPPSEPASGKPLTLTQSAEGPNKDRAIRTAANQMLEVLERDHGIHLKDMEPQEEVERHASSWVETIRNTDINNKNQQFLR